MSYGAISKPAVQALSRGAAMAGCWLNSGEGGVSPYHREAECDLIFQVGTAKYGIRDLDGNFSPEKARTLGEFVKAFEVKLSQGAKPGKGGILPGSKVTEEVSEIRGILPGRDSISPNRHRDISNTEELTDFIARLREIGGRPVGIALSASRSLLAAGVLSMTCPTRSCVAASNMRPTSLPSTGARAAAALHRRHCPIT
jgi:glutamate synthase domain-containing protein 2